MDIKSEILMKQSEIIEELTEMNARLIEMLSQFHDVAEEEEKLKKIKEKREV